MTIVRSTNGDVRGSLDHGIYAFKGIPYAESVGGMARWLPPQRRRPWKGQFDATEYGAACMQFGGGAAPRLPGPRRSYFMAAGGLGPVVEGDDCLLLNVWSPSIDRNARLPVMVYLHGGGFSTGVAGDFYNASLFAAKRVVAVVIQYRLGPPGFLHGSGLFDGELCSDNRAFLDQIEALRWVQENIASFGGDPSCVTVFGESAGAFALYQLAASPLAKGLFHRGIAMGGMAGTCAPADEYHRLTRDVLKEQGISPGDGQALAALDRERLQKVQADISAKTLRSADLERYGSISLGKVAYLGAATATEFLPQPPLSAYPAGTPNDIDLMLGTCAQDGNLFSLTLPLPMSLCAMVFSRYLSGLAPNRDMAAMRKHYAREMPGAGTGRIYQQINNDAFYRMPTIKAAEAHAAGHPGRTFHYQLDYASAIPRLGAIHGIDVALLFRTVPVRDLLRQDAATAALCDLMLEAWTAFAKTGKPGAPGLPEWQPFDTQRRATMVLDDACKLEFDLGGNLRRYWQE